MLLAIWMFVNAVFHILTSPTHPFKGVVVGGSVAIRRGPVEVMLRLLVLLPSPMKYPSTKKEMVTPLLRTATQWHGATNKLAEFNGGRILGAPANWRNGRPSPQIPNRNPSELLP